MSKEWEETKKDLLKHRRENFVIKITTKEDYPHGSLGLSYPEEGEIALSISPDGHHFQSISLLPEEVDKVMKALEPHSSYLCINRVTISPESV